MAIDTKTKRLSILDAQLGFNDTLPEPDSTFDQGDRQHLLDLYGGIAADSPADTTASVIWELPYLEKDWTLGRLSKDWPLEFLDKDWTQPKKR